MRSHNIQHGLGSIGLFTVAGYPSTKLCRQVLLAVLLALSLAPVSRAADVNEEENSRVINWVAFDYTPVYIRTGPFKGKGPGDILLNYYQSVLTDYEHEVTYTNVARMRKFMADANTNSCIVTTLFVEEVAKVRRYGLQNAIHPPLALVTTAANMPQASQWRSVSQERLLKEDGLRLGLPRERFYPGLDAVIQAHRDKGSLMLVSASPVTESLYNLLKSGRFDYTIGLPMEPRYIEKLNELNDAFIVVPLEGATPKPTFPSCTNNAWGEAIIDRLNQEQVRRGAMQAVIDGARYWFGEAQYRAYAQAMQRVFQQPAQVPAATGNAVQDRQ